MSVVQGIDVSTYQRNVDYNKLKAAGIKYVIIRAGFGRYISQKDIMFESHYAAAKAAGLDVGAYWYSYATSMEDAKREAQTCIEAIKEKKFEYPIYFDLEEAEQLKKGRAFCDSLVNVFCTTMEAAGYFAGLYISRSPLQTNISASVANRYALWVAEYASKCNYTGSYGMWQNTSTFHALGYNGNLDHDYCYVDYPTAIKNGGFNGYKKVKPVLDTVGFHINDKGLGVLALKQLMLIASNNSVEFNPTHDGFFDGTEKAVNEFLNEWGYQANGIAGEQFIKHLTKDLTK